MVQEVLHLMGTEIRNTNVSRLVLLKQQSHCCPCVNVVDILPPKPAIFHRPMHMVEIKIAHTQILDGVVDRSLHDVRIMTQKQISFIEDASSSSQCMYSRIIPQLTRDPQVLPAQSSLRQPLSDASTHRLLIPVSFRAVDVSIADLDSV